MKSKRRKFILVIFIIAFAVAAFFIVKNINAGPNLNLPFNYLIETEELNNANGKSNDVDYYTNQVASFSGLSLNNKDNLNKNLNINNSLNLLKNYLLNNIKFLEVTTKTKQSFNELNKSFLELKQSYDDFYKYTTEVLDNFLDLTDKSTADSNDYAFNYINKYSALTKKNIAFYSDLADVLTTSGVKGFSINKITLAYINGVTSCASRVNTLNESRSLLTTSTLFNYHLGNSNLDTSYLNQDTIAESITNAFNQIAKVVI